MCLHKGNEKTNILAEDALDQNCHIWHICSLNTTGSGIMTSNLLFKVVEKAGPEDKGAALERETQDDAEVVEIFKKEKEKKEGLKEEVLKEEDEVKDEKKRGGEDETPRSLKTMSPAEKVNIRTRVPCTAFRIDYFDFALLSLLYFQGEPLAPWRRYVGLRSGQYRNEPNN